MAEAPKRPTHFLAVRLMHPALHEFGRAVQSSVRQSFPEIASGLTNTDKLHITLGILTLNNEDEILQARASLRSFVVDSLRPLVQSGKHGKPRIVFRESTCLGSFPRSGKALNVLYVQSYETNCNGAFPTPPPLPLRTLSALAMNAVGGTALRFDASTNDPIPDPSFEPHATLWKQSKMGRRASTKSSRDARAALRQSLESLVFWNRGDIPVVEGRIGRSVRSKGRYEPAVSDTKTGRLEAVVTVTDVALSAEQLVEPEAGIPAATNAHSASDDGNNSRQHTLIARETTTNVIAMESDGSGFPTTSSSLAVSQPLQCSYDWPRDEHGQAIEVIEEINSVLLCSMIRPGPRRASSRGTPGSLAVSGERLEPHEGFGLHPEVDGFYFVEEEVAF